MSDTNPAESTEAEGLPPLAERRPGIDAETDSEGMMVPRDHPVAAGSDPSYAVTAEEEREREGVADRAEREQPDVGADDLGVGGGVQGRRWRAGAPAPSDAGNESGRLYAPRSGDRESGEGSDLDTYGEALAASADPDEAATSAEEAAVREEEG